MSDIKKIATRDSYGNALVELGKEKDNVVVLDADLAEGCCRLLTEVEVRRIEQEV